MSEPFKTICPLCHEGYYSNEKHNCNITISNQFMVKVCNLCGISYYFEKGHACREADKSETKTGREICAFCHKEFYFGRNNKYPKEYATYEEMVSDYKTHVTLCRRKLEPAGLQEHLTKTDVVNHPPHYTFSKYEVADVLDEWFPEDTQEWNAVKYITRAKHKGNRIEDLKKAVWYLNRKIKILENKK